ncbi:TspO and MBR like protein [Kangiella koreensis DSM 16069]|uniref:TspO and MBR like protein n=2 Tax=Kangiella TaxID=261963 RepID=C7R6M3_KANKD|nr:TspO/MBR family protein [Kangiella koreensis]ACV25539.1 TspO and MBR like protein [Kangiella koreensis DSM 16069]
MSKLKKSTELLGLFGWLIVVFITATIGAIASVDAGEFYSQLEKPSWAPPGWLFGPVWTVLYAFMGIAAWLVWRERYNLNASLKRVHAGLTVFLMQLVLNALWSWLFFSWHLGGWAFVDIVVLWIFIGFTVVGFLGVNKLAALLIAPYLLWVLFAAILNYAVWKMNPALLGS